MTESTPLDAHTRIYLAGFMGTGKSTLGPAVAALLGWTFVDLDDEIERLAGRTIREIFEAGGEKAFRDVEREAVRGIAERERVVVALGGGAVLDPGNRSRLVRSGVVVCLTARLATLAHRLVDEAASRPLLQDDAGEPLHGDALARRIRELLAARRAAYDAAHVAIDTDRGSIEETARRIVNAVRGLSGSPDPPGS